MPIADFKGLSERQWEYIERSVWSERDIQFLYGSVRSGKNFSNAIRLAMYLANEPEGYADSDFAFFGVSTKVVYRVLLRDIFDLVGEENYTYNRQDGSGRIFDREFFSFGFTKANSVEPLRGLTLGGFAGTEATFCHQDFFDESQLRLSYEGAKGFWDTNPGPPSHYIKQILDDPKKAENFEIHHFLLKDNPWIMANKKVVARFLSMYPPGTLLHKRMIEGKWAAAEGAIYDTITDANYIHESELPREFDGGIHVGIDHGYQNACVFLLIGLHAGTYYIFDEYYYSGTEKGMQQSDSDYLLDFKRFIEGHDVSGIFPDPNATGFIVELKKAGFAIEDVDNSVAPGIHCLIGLFGNNRIKIVKAKCPKTSEQLLGYRWCPKAQSKGKEVPIKKDDHCLTGDTVIHTVDGPEEIKNLVGKTGRVHCVDVGSKSQTTAPFYDVRMTRKNAPILEIETEDGRKIKLTEDHMVLTTKGWIEAKNLTLNDYIISVNTS